MSSHQNLEKVMNLDPIIGTFTARDLQNNPDFVEKVYLEHAETHMSLGDTSEYLERLNRWIKQNRGAVIGAISGDFGYGKTSLGIHLWNQIESNGVIAIPPFEWFSLQDIIDATWAWVRFRLEKIKPTAVMQLELIYDKYREKSVNQFANEHDIPVSTVQKLVRMNQVSLRSQPVDVIEFLQEVSVLLESSDLNLFGPIVFTDELQVTMSRYQDENRSRDEFMQDLFELLNTLINKQGSYGLIVSFPVNTETIINNVRSDIIQRFQNCNLLIRPSNMYDREFPSKLWEKFAKVFEFEDIADLIIPQDTLDSLGQISFRNDLGAGPRTVIEAMRYAANYYINENKSLYPVDLMDAYLNNHIAYNAGGKLISVVNEVLQSNYVNSTSRGDQVIKLMAAYPMGCKDEYFEKYDLAEIKDEISKRLFAEYFYKYSEGISLRGLAQSERPVEPIFLQLTRDYIQTYSESDRNLKSAVSAFRELVIKGKLLEKRSQTQIIGWISDADKGDQYIGTFDKKYPDRKLLVKVSTERNEFINDADEFGLFFWIDQNCDYEDAGGIVYADENEKMALFRLNLKRRPSKILSISFVEEMGYSLKKATPMFMLGLIDYINSNSWDIPEDEQIQLKPFIRSLLDYSVEFLFSPDILENSEIKGLSKVGLTLPQEVFSRMCRRTYSDYDTLITTGNWEKSYTKYLSALSSSMVSSSLSVLRGNRELVLEKRDDVMKLFGENKAQTVTALATNLSSILDVEFGPRDDSSGSKLKFKLHPAEQLFVDALRSSKESIKQNQLSLKVLDQHEGFYLLRSLGYRLSEIKILLDMLKSRRLIDFDEKRQIFVEVLESPIERREAIIAQLTKLTRQADVLKNTDFDRERFLAVVTRLREQVSICDDIEELEDYQAQLIPLREELTQFSKKWANKIETNFDQIHNTTIQIINAGLPTDITRPLQGDVSWVSELLQCQVLIKNMYQRSFEALRNVDRKATMTWSKWESASDYDLDALVVLYETNITVKNEFDDAKVKLETAKGYLGSFQAWLSLLSISSRAHVEAINCEASYNESQFREELSVIFGEIEGRFKDKRLEALPDHEMFETRIMDVQGRIEGWLRDRRQNFMEVKAFCEEMLKTIGVEKSNLHATFDPFDPGTSRSNLFSETLEKIQHYVQVIEENVNRSMTEILYAKQVMGIDVTVPKEKLQEIKGQLKEVKKEIVEECLRDNKCFALLGGEINKIDTNLEEVEQLLRGIFTKRDITTEEEAILGLLQDPKGTDLSLVITSQLERGSESFTLDILMSQIASLFRKNQIIVSLSKRR